MFTPGIFSLQLMMSFSLKCFSYKCVLKPFILQLGKKEACKAERKRKNEISHLHNKVCEGDFDPAGALNSKQAEF